MFVELHMIQNFAPSCLNRDDTNAPKDCEFGGYRRARISSQCLKRSMRKQFEADGSIDQKNLGIRTKHVIEEIVRLLKAKGKDETQAEKVARAVLSSMKIAADDAGKTQYLLFLGREDMGRLADLCIKHWDALVKAGEAPAAAGEEKSGKDKKKAAKAAIPAEVANEATKVLTSSTAVDVALFGRMLADSPDFNIDAACQVAHAMSTHKVNMEMDFFTAVDDIQVKEESGAGMMGTVEFNSACFYRYSVISLKQLLDNLGGNKKLAQDAIAAFIKAAVAAIPTGKQNSMAAHNPPSFVMVVVRKSGQPVSLANAFAQPVSIFSAKDTSIIGESVSQLITYHTNINAMYGKDGIVLTAACQIDGKKLPDDVKVCKNIDELVGAVVGKLV